MSHFLSFFLFCCRRVLCLLTTAFVFPVRRSPLMIAPRRTRGIVRGAALLVFVGSVSSAFATIPSVTACATPPPSGTTAAQWFSAVGTTQNCGAGYGTLIVVSQPYEPSFGTCRMGFSCTGGGGVIYQNWSKAPYCSTVPHSHLSANPAECECDPGYTESGGACVPVVPPDPPACGQGAKQSKIIGVGFAAMAGTASGAMFRTEDGRGFLRAQGALGGVPDQICDGQCSWVLDGAPSDVWYDASPNASGLHRLYREQGYMRTGGTCTAKTPAADSSQSGTCNGFTGQINGKTVCVEKVPAPDQSVASRKPSTTAAGAAPVDAGTGSTGPNGEVPGKAGDKSGLVDLSGTGAGSGGSGTGGTGGGTGTISGPNGTSTFELKLDLCGGKGQPPCRIDETGVKTKLDEDLTIDKVGLSATAKELRDKVGGSGDKAFFSGVWSNFFNVPPLVQCSDVAYPALGGGQSVGSLDICGSVAWAREVMGWIWAFLAFWVCLRMVRGAL